MVESAVISPKKNNATDGGATAIGGYVFQILATSSDQITAESFGGSDPYSDAVIYVHEAFDQDAAKASTLSDKVTLIQVKYSANASHNKINPSELDEIASRLQKSAKSAVIDGLAVTGFQLLSNRGLSVLAKKTLTKCRKDKAALNPKKPTKKWVLAKLKEITLSETVMKKNLYKFGASFGLRSTEIDKKIEHLTGKIFTEVARKKTHAMSLGDVRDVFLGTSDARKLTRISMGEQFKAEIAKIRSQVEGKHVPRSRASRVLKENPTRALFVFLGQGGMGKSASLENLMKEELASEDGSMLRAGKGADIPIDWAASCLDDWRRTPKVAGKDLLDALERLRIANPKNRPPILTLALDGIDEGVKELHEDYVRSLIRELAVIDKESRALPGKIPEVRLIVTCREEVELTRFLPTDISGFDLHGEEEHDYWRVEFGPFTPEEFRIAVRADEPGLFDEIFQGPASVAGLSAYALGTTPGLVAGPSIYGHLRFLCDPMIWRAFTMLAEADKKKVLINDPEGEKRLGEKLLTRFCKKTEARCNWNPNKGIAKALKALAKEFNTTKKDRNRPNWLEVAGKVGGFGYNECDKLFDEALNGGLITGGSNAWEWRHRIIERALEI